jgi:hypothetical protein
MKETDKKAKALEKDADVGPELLDEPQSIDDSSVHATITEDASLRRTATW